MRATLALDLGTTFGWARGRGFERAVADTVKLVGATAHYVTADLDEGPIIEQDVVRVDHRMTPEDLVRAGEEVESRVLARAVRWHCATPGGQLFWAVPNMELADRKRLFRALSEQGLPPGLRLTVGFAGYSAKTGKPLQPKGLAVRSYEEGAAADPIARLLAAPGAKSG